MTPKEELSPAVARLNEAGQSVWYDNLSRSVLRNGELAGLIARGVSGLTSNPTIFKKAIADTSDYDEDISLLARDGLDAEGICESLFVSDVGGAADLLRPIYDRTAGADGYASVEVSPLLANDTAGTVEAGRRLWEKLARPNVMIKVPATPAGISAVKTLLEQGINVNITLIFSADVYEEVIEAYLSALEARAARGEPQIGVASVASFFVSRVDAIVEKEFDRLGKEAEKAEFLGRVGIANCKIAYARFKERFEGSRVAPLLAKGAKVQRPLWASTGTKNPRFSPVMYVEALAARDTVNTVPPATLEAIFKGVSITGEIDDDPPAAHQFLDRLKRSGIFFEKLLLTLREEGVDLFRDSYNDLLASIEEKRRRLAES